MKSMCDAKNRLVYQFTLKNAISAEASARNALISSRLLSEAIQVDPA